MRGTERAALIISDVAAFVIAGIVANTVHWLYSGLGHGPFLRIWESSMAEPRLVFYGTFVLVTLIWFWARGHYERRRPFWDEVAEITKVVGLIAIFDAATLYMAKVPFSRMWFLATWCLAYALIPSLRFLLRYAMLRRGRWRRSSVILGVGDNATNAVNALLSEPLMGIDVIAFVSLEAEPTTTALEVANKRIPVLAASPELEHQLAKLGVSSVILAPERDDLDRAVTLGSHLHTRFSDLSIVPPLKGLPLYGMEAHHFFRHEVLFLRLQNNLAKPTSRFIKRASDLIGASLLLLFLSPVFLFLSLRIRADGGPAFFRHRRVGQHGKPFVCYKFRTMVPDARAALEHVLATDPERRREWQRHRKLKNDPRVTPVGRFLRQTSLDELPQLWNVIKGDMSLVGPRPVVEEELQRYGDDVRYYLEARPGMTGLWQISGRNDANYESRVYLDVWYVKNWSLWYDIVILIRTSEVVLRREGAY